MKKHGMKIKDGYVKVASYDGYVVTPIGEESKRNKIMITLNDTAAEIWDMLMQEKSEEEIARTLAEIYGISYEKAKTDVAKVVEPLKKEGILVE